MNIWLQIFFRYGLLPLLLFAAIEFLLVKKERLAALPLIFSGGFSALAIYLLVRPIDVVAGLYEKISGSYNTEAAGFYLLFFSVAALSALAGTLAGWAFAAGSGRERIH